MSDSYRQLQQRCRDWFEQACEDGWLEAADRRAFDELEHASPDDLFTDAERRPLVVAFFGGTGAGKSSLLNRLAGRTIARTGVERPTSRSVTVYVHESVALADLPDELPVEKVELCRHDDQRHRDVLWLDAPDIDSVEQQNRELALAWLPHVDLLVYVVSPERYRDDVGWRVLQQRRGRHGWLFVMNRWDEGQPDQRADFVELLRSAGFDDPVLLCTSCAPHLVELPSPDEFDRLQQTIADLLDAHALRELKRLGHAARLRELHNTLHAAMRRIGQPDQWELLQQALAGHWDKTRLMLAEGLEFPLRELAGRFATRQRSGLSQAVDVLRSVRPGIGSISPRSTVTDDSLTQELSGLLRPLWDDWAQQTLREECVSAVELEARRLGLRPDKLRAALDAVVDQAADRVVADVQQRLRAALARPGTVWQRAGRRVTGFLMGFLPIVALMWVGFNLLRGYYNASRGQAQYPGVDFAVSSVLLVALSWAVPFVIDRLLKPSTERIAERAMRTGLAVALDVTGQRLTDQLAAVRRQAEKLLDQARSIETQITQVLSVRVDLSAGPLRRVVAGAGDAEPAVVTEST